MDPRLTVAWDGSGTSAAAARWAARHAVATGSTVRLLHVRPPADGGPELVRPRRNDIELAAVDAMTATARELALAHPGLVVDTAVEEGEAAAVLNRAADRAGTLVLGTRGAGPAALVLGSVALAVASRAQSPVILVPPTAAGAPTDREVVVGLDLAGDCGPALTFGFERARSLGTGLRALHVWRGPTALSVAVDPRRDQAAAREADERMVSTELAAVHAFFPDVEAVSEEIAGSPGPVLRAAGEKASLLVLGRRRRRPAPALGPVVPAVLGRTACPVAVVPHR